jgi:GT2 family glycosyltransferase
VSKRGLSIILVTWNGLHLLKKHLDTIINATNSFKYEHEIILVDNNSIDRTKDVVEYFYPSIIYKKLDSNYGYGYANNYGVKISKYDSILLLNNDVTIEGPLLNKLYLFFKKQKNIFSASPLSYYYKNKVKTNKIFCSSIYFSYSKKFDLIQKWKVKNFKNTSPENDLTIYGSGACLMIDKKKFIDLNGFDRIYGLAYWEDVDLCLRAWSKGWKSLIFTKGKIWHEVSASDIQTNLKQYLIFKNYIILNMRFLKNPYQKIIFLLNKINTSNIKIFWELKFFILSNLFWQSKFKSIDEIQKNFKLSEETTDTII